MSAPATPADICRRRASRDRRAACTRLSTRAGRDRAVDHIHTIYRDPTTDYGAKIAGR
jgi:hypothetical protein